MAAPPIIERHLPHFHRRSPIKELCRAATTANITISTALNSGDVIDGVTLADGDRVLVKDQSTGSQNGIYVVGATPVRDYDESTDDPSFGYLVLVLQGTANAGTLWHNTNTSAPTIGSTALTFAAFTGSGLSDPMTTRGDIIYRNPSNVTARLGIGGSGTVLSSDGTDASWQTPSSGFANPMTTKGDLIVGDTGGSPIRKGVGSDGQVLTADAASTGGMKWNTASGGGGLTHTFAGYNTVGGSYESMITHRWYAKKITLASAGLLASIGAYIQATTSDSVGGAIGVCLWDDASGTPDHVLSFITQFDDTALLDNVSGGGGVSRPRWLHRPVGMWLAAGDYWIGIAASDITDTIQVAYDGSGSDRYFTAGGHWVADWGWYTPTTSSNKYSIRADVLT